MKPNQQLHWDKEEIANILTHGIGVISSAVGLIFLVYFATHSPKPSQNSKDPGNERFRNRQQKPEKRFP